MKIDSLTPNGAVIGELGKRLARIRRQHGYSQEQLASAAGIGVATLRRIEGGQDSQLESWIKILKALELTAAIDALLPEDFRSPMADVRRERKQSAVADEPVWGDESK